MTAVRSRVPEGPVHNEAGVPAAAPGLSADPPAPGPGSLADADLLALVRRFEPVLRFTSGEMFYPMSVESYVGQAALWAEDPTGERRLLVDHGQLTVDRLCRESRAATPGVRLELRYVPGPLRRRRLRQWRRDPNRPRIRAFTRLAAVGLLGRLLDVVFRLSLLVRGRVPGGLVAAAHVAYSTSGGADSHPYYAHVTTDGGYVVVQYWFLYAMNNWRTSFAGVNDHEADWEQVTVFLTTSDSPHAAEAGAAGPDSAESGGRLREGAPGPAGLRAAWVAFSSHDDAGAELRRRWDDPDLQWVGATHPVVQVGAGSHSGAYLPGDYLVRVEPPVLSGWLHAARRARDILMPWARERNRRGLGIPYIDYKRGDGRAIGPGTDRVWQPVLVTSATDWVRDYRDAWGLDTDDPFGGERAPAGPRYERAGTIRESWADPVAWAGLDQVPASTEEQARLERARLSELQLRRDRLDALIAGHQERVRRLSVSAAGRPAGAGARRHRATGTPLEESVMRLRDLRAERRAVDGEREHLLLFRPGEPTDPHAHLRHRSVPDTFRHRPHRLLRVWSEISLSVFLTMVGVALLFDLVPGYQAPLDAVVIVLAIEAVMRRRLMVFLLTLGVIAAALALLVLLVTNFRMGVGALALSGAVAIGVANLRSLLARR